MKGGQDGQTKAAIAIATPANMQPTEIDDEKPNSVANPQRMTARPKSLLDTRGPLS